MTSPSDDRRFDLPGRRRRRGLYVLPSIFTVGNLFCGYASIVYAMRGGFDNAGAESLKTAAACIGLAILLDSLDGFIARATGTSSAFGLQLDSLADVVSFGLAPALLAFCWGLSDFGEKGWAAGFVYVTACAMRLARFNIQSPTMADKRYFVGMPSPAAAGVVAATVFLTPAALRGYPQAFGLAVVIVPALLMVTTIRFRSLKTMNVGWVRSYRGLLFFSLLLASVVAYPQWTLATIAYGYLISPFIGLAASRIRARRGQPPSAT